MGELRDPRPRRLWSRYTELSLPVPKFKVKVADYYSFHISLVAIVVGITLNVFLILFITAG